MGFISVEINSDENFLCRFTEFYTQRVLQLSFRHWYSGILPMNNSDSAVANDSRIL